MSDETDVQESTERSREPERLTGIRFDDFPVPTEILAGLKDLGNVYCTPLQAEILPLVLAGRDVVCLARTGSGKTAAFLVSLFAGVLSLHERRTDIPSALIVAPTQDLCLRIYEEARSLGRYTGLDMTMVVRGHADQGQVPAFSENAALVVGTPGGVIDFYKKGLLKTEGIKFLVVDEAERLFTQRLAGDMRYLLRKLPHSRERVSILFSGVLSYRVLAVTYDFMNLPDFVTTTPDQVRTNDIDQSLFHVASEEKLRLLLGLLKREPWKRALIFVSSGEETEELSQKLKDNGLAAEGVIGEWPQNKRRNLMARFKGGKLRILVTTDDVARGIHVEEVTLVVNYRLPQDGDTYLRRLGRVTVPGRAISFASEGDAFFIEPIEQKLGCKLPVLWPQDDWFKEGQAETPAPPEPEEPPAEPERRHPREKKDGIPFLAGKKVVFSSEPGGVFGLAVEHKASAPSEPGKPQKRKKRHRSRPRKQKGGAKAPAETPPPAAEA
ncbi:MAG: DEAD/DEAH box helicase [Desulfobacterota bacterium]|nr:DEAD/DEAH box helicase [Thermodesulfobacteriota bacterium]